MAEATVSIPLVHDGVLLYTISYSDERCLYYVSPVAENPRTLRLATQKG